MIVFLWSFVRPLSLILKYSIQIEMYILIRIKFIFPNWDILLEQGIYPTCVVYRT